MSIFTVGGAPKLSVGPPKRSWGRFYGGGGHSYFLSLSNNLNEKRRSVSVPLIDIKESKAF